MKTLEEYRRGDDQRRLEDILAGKLYWTFQPEKIGDLVTKGVDAALCCAVWFDNSKFFYKFGKDTVRQIPAIENHVEPRSSNSIFLPAKEVLSLHQIILKSREQDKLFGFDDTYLDLARALRQSPTKGRNYPEFASSRESLEDILGGRVEYDEKGAGRWQFKRATSSPLVSRQKGLK